MSQPSSSCVTGMGSKRERGFPSFLQLRLPVPPKSAQGTLEKTMLLSRQVDGVMSTPFSVLAEAGLGSTYSAIPQTLRTTAV